MQRRFRPRRRLILGAAAAALLGVMLGAWLKPSPTAAPEADPYENVVVALPAEPSAPVDGLTSAAWYTAQTPALPEEPDSGLAPTSAQAEDPASWSPWDSDQASAPDPAVLTRVDDVLPAPEDDAPAWPSAQGDILAAEDAAEPAHAEVEPECTPAPQPQAAAARSGDPRDWDLPASAYQSTGFEVRPRADAAPTSSPPPG